MAWLRSLPRFDSSPASPAPGAQKPRVVVLGTIWAECRLMKGIDTRLYDVVCISPNEYEMGVNRVLHEKETENRIKARRMVESMEKKSKQNTSFIVVILLHEQLSS
ncbi:unnamed protein product [Musa acuminata var. zebrina]